MEAMIRSGQTRRVGAPCVLRGRQRGTIGRTGWVHGGKRLEEHPAQNECYNTYQGVQAGE